MAFRRPRLNVKPNVQATRPVNDSARSQDSTVESTSSQSQEDHVTQQNETITIPTIVIEPPPPTIVEEKIEPLPPPPPPPPPVSPTPVPLPIAVPSTSAPPSPPPPSSIPIARALIRRKILPTISGKTAIQHRRPSASCSGTESESESTRQKHALASTITFGRPSQPAPKPTISNETSINPIPDSPIEEDPTASTKVEAMLVETSAIDSSLINHNRNSLPTRTNTRVSAEYLTQHINYRAQRLAAKVEPGMTIRKRRAATLEKLNETGGNQNGAVDTSKLKIADFVHYNPVANPMEAKAKARVDIPNDPVRKQSISSTDGPNSILAPQLKIDANGALVVDEESLYIRNVDDTPRNTVIVEGQFNDDNLTHRSHRKIGRRKRWNNRDTLRFYQALRMCGTDFTLIARFFPNRDRDDIKRKFKTEDKANRTLVDSALRQRIPFDLTCFYSPSEESSNDENGSDVERIRPKRTRKRRVIKRKSKPTSADPLEINRRREKRLQAKKNSTRMKKSAEFIHEEDEDDDDDEESSMDIADTVEVTTTALQSKLEQVIPSIQNEENPTENSLTNLSELENLLGQIDGSHLLFVHNTDENTGLDRIDVHVVMTNTTADNNEQSI